LDDYGCKTRINRVRIDQLRVITAKGTEGTMR
jgi:hypothetical protein